MSLVDVYVGAFLGSLALLGVLGRLLLWPSRRRGPLSHARPPRYR